MLLFLIVGMVLGLTISPSPAQDFYRNKTVHFVVAYAAGGGYDTYTRVIAKHIGKHIPGQPSTVVENRTGAGGLLAVNFLYNQAKPDGLTVGNWNGMLGLQQLLGLNGAEFDAQRFESIGAPIRPNPTCIIAKASGITTLEQWMGAKKPVKLGGLGPGTTNSDMARILSAALGLPTQLVEGYKGGADVRLALDSGELEGMCGVPWEIVKSTWRKQLEYMNVVIQGMPKAHPDIPEVPLAINVAKTEEARQLIRVGLHNVTTVTQIYSAPPNTPKDRVQILRKAFLDTLKNPEFLADAKKAQLEFNPVAGEDVSEIISGFAQLSSSLKNRLKDILLPKKN
jgi:tripartite-type tricarboxylate transporter receptor subunit TctC